MQQNLIKIFSFIKKHEVCIALLLFASLAGVFFYRTVLNGKLPVPSDTLVGLYYPYRDFYAQQYPNGIPFKNFLITDPIRQQIPWRKSVIDFIRQGKFPLWNAWSFSGTPLLANIQAGALYPLNILFLFFPFDIAWTTLIVSQPLLAGFFLYCFLRNKKLEVLASLFGATTFAYSGFSIAWLTWGTMLSTLLWVPLTLLSIDKLIEKRSKEWQWGLICVLSIVFSFFAGHIQIFLYGMCIVLAYIVWNYRRITFRPIYIWILVLVGLITAPQWISMFRWLPQTMRVAEGASWQTEGFFIPLRHLAQFIAPDFFGNPATLNYWGTWNYGEMIGYVGVGGLIFAILGFGSGTIFWVFIIGVSLLFAVSSPISMLPFQLHIPIISVLQPTRLLSIVDFSLSVLAAYGFSKIMKGKHKKLIISAIVCIFSIVLILWASVVFHSLLHISADNALVAKHNLIVPTVLVFVFAIFLGPFALFTSKTNRKYFVLFGISLIILSVVDLFRFGWKFTPFTDRTYFFSETKTLSFLENQEKPFRVMATDDRILPPNENEFYGIESVNGYDPLQSSRYEEFMAAFERGKPDIQPPFGFDRILAPKNVNSPLLPLMNVRYILSFDALRSDTFQPVNKEGQTITYRFSNALPRVYFVQSLIYADTKQRVINALFDHDVLEGLAAVVEKHVNLLPFPLSFGEEATIRSYKPDKLEIDATVNMARFLVVSNIFDSGWKVTIDNRPALIYRTNYIFMGILVPTGRHIITLYYQ